MTKAHMETVVDKDRLAAFADGEMTPEEAAAMVMHLADTPQDQAYVDDLLSGNELLAAAFGAPLHEAVPPAIRATIFGAADAGLVLPQGVVAMRKPGRFAVIGGSVLGGALAAGLAVIAVLPGLSGSTSDQILTPGTVPAGTALHAALQTLPSGTNRPLDDAGELAFLASFQTSDGRYCREFELIRASGAELDFGVICRAPNEPWTIEVVLREPMPDDLPQDDSFLPASGPEFRALEVFLDEAGAGPTLDAETESALIASGWNS